jgi:hypothetical protein
MRKEYSLSMQSYAVKKTPSSFRFCDRQEKYMSIAACLQRSGLKPVCKRCLDKWRREHLQLPLPFPRAKDARGRP